MMQRAHSYYDACCQPVGAVLRIEVAAVASGPGSKVGHLATKNAASAPRLLPLGAADQPLGAEIARGP
jgi:hypothetical protein